MKFLSFFFMGVAKVVDMALFLYMIVILARAVLSWVNPDPNNPIVRFLYSITEPVLYRVRRALPMPGLGIDLSPLIVIMAIYFLQIFLVNSLYLVADNLR